MCHGGDGCCGGQWAAGCGGRRARGRGCRTRRRKRSPRGQTLLRLLLVRRFIVVVKPKLSRLIVFWNSIPDKRYYRQVLQHTSFGLTMCRSGTESGRRCAWLVDSALLLLHSRALKFTRGKPFTGCVRRRRTAACGFGPQRKRVVLFVPYPSWSGECNMQLRRGEKNRKQKARWEKEKLDKQSVGRCVDRASYGGFLFTPL